MKKKAAKNSVKKVSLAGAKADGRGNVILSVWDGDELVELTVEIANLDMAEELQDAAANAVDEIADSDDDESEDENDE